jgi:plasmid stabilization system protein ParE
MIVRYKKQALRDIERIHDYIAEFDPGAAKRVVERIGHSIGRLNVLPLSGRPGRREGNECWRYPVFRTSLFIVCGTSGSTSLRCSIRRDSEEAEGET